MSSRFGEVYAIRSHAGAYVGSALGYSTARWAMHLRLLRRGIHHCKKLQNTFDETGAVGLSFQVLIENVPERDLRRAEYDWCLALDGISTPPVAEVKKETQRIVCLDLMEGMPYREIAYKHRISLGTISAIKVKYRVELPKNRNGVNK